MEEIIKNGEGDVIPDESAPMIDECDVDTEPTDEMPGEGECDEVLSPLETLMRVGLSEREAKLVLDDRERERTQNQRPPDSLPRMARSPRVNISYGELMQMKEIFEGLSDAEINRLYNKVTK